VPDRRPAVRARSRASIPCRQRGGWERGSVNDRRSRKGRSYPAGAALAVTVAEGAPSAEAGQSAPRAGDDLRLFRPRRSSYRADSRGPCVSRKRPAAQASAVLCRLTRLRELISRQTRREAGTQSQRSRPSEIARPPASVHKSDSTNGHGGQTDTTTLVRRSRCGGDAVVRSRCSRSRRGPRRQIGASRRGQQAQA
jgi:hypothetical protein